MPEWNEKYQYLLSNTLTGNESNLMKNINKFNELIIVVKDLKTLGIDGIIGQIKIDLNKQLLTPTITSSSKYLFIPNLIEWYSLKHNTNKKPAGKIMLNFKINSSLLGYGNQIPSITRNNNLIKNIHDYEPNYNEIQKNKSQIRFSSNSKKSKLHLVMNHKNEQILNNNIKRDYSAKRNQNQLYYTGFKGVQSPQKIHKFTNLKSTLISAYNKQQQYQNTNIHNYKKLQDFRRPIQFAKNHNDTIKKIPYNDLIAKQFIKSQPNNKNVIFSFCS